MTQRRLALRLWNIDRFAIIIGRQLWQKHENFNFVLRFINILDNIIIGAPAIGLLPENHTMGFNSAAATGTPAKIANPP
jgi:hypothetical protein